MKSKVDAKLLLLPAVQHRNFISHDGKLLYFCLIEHKKIAITYFMKFASNPFKDFDYVQWRAIQTALLTVYDIK